jgi:hypothetical protein
MKTTLKWILLTGAIFSVFILLGLSIFNRFWMGQVFFPITRYDMMRGGYHHSSVMFGASYGGIVGAVLVMVILGIIFVASQSKTQSVPDAQPELLDNCPVCDADLEHDWKHCPHCGYDLYSCK